MAAITYGEFEGSEQELQDMMRISDLIGWGRYGKPAELRREIDARKASDGMFILTAKNETGVVGWFEVYAKPTPGWSVPSDKTAYIHAVAVSPEAQRSGIAKVFAKHLLGVLKAKGYTEALTDIAAANEASIKLTKSMGAGLQGDSPAAVANLRAAPQVRFHLAL